MRKKAHAFSLSRISGVSKSGVGPRPRGAVAVGRSAPIRSGVGGNKGSSRHLFYPNDLSIYLFIYFSLAIYLFIAKIDPKRIPKRAVLKF